MYRELNCCYFVLDLGYLPFSWLKPLIPFGKSNVSCLSFWVASENMAVIPGVLFKVSGGESLLCAVFDRKGTPFVYLLLTKLFFLGGGG